MPHLQERLQGLWEVYQRLGLEDDIVDPSNTLLREGPVLKISFRRSDPMERYLFLVGAAGLRCQVCPGNWKSESEPWLASKPVPLLCALKTVQKEGIRLATGKTCWAD